ncbi:MAG TPA: HDOD domain-containing protein [Polyangiaceae bacterium]
MAQTTTATSKQGAAARGPVLVDEELWFGTTDTSAAESAAAKSMAATAGSVVGTKPFPESAHRLAELSRRDPAPVQEMVEVLENDPALSARLLRFVNSASLGLRQRCTTIRHAVTLVGTKQLHQLATTAAVMDLFDDGSGEAVAVLEHSAVVGAFCRYLGTHLGLPAEDLFTAGVLHDIGKLMLLDTFGESYLALLNGCVHEPETIYARERKEYGFDHGILAAHVLKTWNIPDPLPKIIAWHHEPTRAYASSPLHGSLVQTLRLSDLIANLMQRGATRADVRQVTQHEAASYLDISEAQLDAMWDELATLRDHALHLKRSEGNSTDPKAAESTTRVKVAAKDGLAEVPQQFRCAKCGSASYGTACPACHGYVCTSHPIDNRGWCAVCDGEFDEFARKAFPVTSLHAATGASLIAVTGSVAGWASDGSAGLMRHGLAAIIIAMFAFGAFVLARRSYLRAKFIRTRPNRSA